MKYDINGIYSTKNDLEVKINQTGSRAMIREKGQEKATPRQGFRVICGDETVGYGDWHQTEHDLLCEVVKKERYAHLAYKEAYKGGESMTQTELNNALCWASMCGHVEVVKELLKAGANVHTREDFALRHASGCGHVEVVKVLLKAGADIHARDDYALIWASENGHIEVVKELKKYM